MFILVSTGNLRYHKYNRIEILKKFKNPNKPHFFQQKKQKAGNS